MSTPLPPAAPRLAPLAPFVVCAFPGSGVDHLLAALVGAPGLDVQPPRLLLASAPDPSPTGAARVVTHGWMPAPVAPGLALIRNPFHVVADLSASLPADPDKASAARMALITAISRTLFEAPAADWGPDAMGFAAVVTSLWARHARQVLDSGWPVLQLEQFCFAPEAWTARIVASASAGATLSTADATALTLPPQSLQTPDDPLRPSSAERDLIALIAGPTLGACGYRLSQDNLDVQPPQVAAALPEGATRVLDAQLQTQRAVLEGLETRTLEAIAKVQARERTVGILSRMANDLCRQQEAMVKQNHREMTKAQADLARAETHLAQQQAHADTLYRNLMAVADSHLTLADLTRDPAPPAFVRCDDHVIVVDHAKSAKATISLRVPWKWASSWLVLLEIEVEAGAKAAPPPLTLSYRSGGKDLSQDAALSAGRNHLRCLVTAPDLSAPLRLVVPPRPQAYRIQNLALVPLAPTSKDDRTASGRSGLARYLRPLSLMGRLSRR